jgi:hypothetical protein
MSKNLEAVAVLERFAPQIRWVISSVMSSFELEPHFKDDVRQEAEIQVMSYANLLDEPIWMTGALAKWEVRANGDETQVKAMLAYQLRIALAQITSRMIHRNGEESMHDSLNRIEEEWNSEPQCGPGETFNVFQPPAEPEVSYEDVAASLADPGSRYLRRFVKEFPFLAMQIIGELTIEEIRVLSKSTLRQVTYRLKMERDELAVVWEYEGSIFGDWLRTLTRDELKKIRRSGLYDYLMIEVSEKLTDNGIVYLLRTEGDEDLEDLVEAKTNLFMVGR